MFFLDNRWSSSYSLGKVSWSWLLGYWKDLGLVLTGVIGMKPLGGGSGDWEIGSPPEDEEDEAVGLSVGEAGSAEDDCLGDSVTGLSLIGVRGDGGGRGRGVPRPPCR